MSFIRQFWELFVQAESSSYEKSSWCDLFLSQFIVELNNGSSVDEILTFCNWSGVGTLIGCELLYDIDQVCSQPGDGEDLRPLKHHLYTRGWRALTVLLALSQQNFSCSNELANLLISLFPICLETKEKLEGVSSSFKANNKYLRLREENDLDSCFTLSPGKSKFSGVCGGLAPKAEHFRAHVNTFSSRNRRWHRGAENIRYSADTHSSESENPCEDLNAITKSYALKIKLDPMDFDYFTSVVRSDDEDDARLDSVLYEPRRRQRRSKKITPADFMDEKIKDVMQSQVSPYEFSMLVIQLLTSLCRSEHDYTLTAENSYPVCLKNVKFALENLCSIQFGSISTHILESHEAADLKSSLTQLLVISLEKVMGCPDVTTNVILTGILPMMLRVLEDSVCKLTSEVDPCDSNEIESSKLYEKEKQQQVIFGLICSVITFLISFLLQNSDADRVRNFLELFKIFIESNSGRLIDKTVVSLTKFGNTARAKKVVDLIGHFVTVVKKVRKEMVDPHTCKKFKHKKCKDESEMHHHHDLFGAVFAAPVVGSNSQQNCCVSALFLVLVRLLKKPDEIPTDVLNRTLKVMTFCGTCCCFVTKNLMTSLAEIIKVSPHKSRVQVFNLLESRLYPESGGFSSFSRGKSSCVICSKHYAEDCDFPKQTKELSGDAASVKSSKHFSSDIWSEGCQLGNSTLPLDSFRELLSSTDFRIVQGVTCHLLKCAPKMNQFAKHSILFSIFLPTFQTSKTQFFSVKDDISIFRIVSSLSMFSTLLDNVTITEEFISKKGLNHVLDLISVPAFTKHCCSVIQKTIIMTVLTSETNVSKVPSLITLRNAVDNANAEFLKHFGTTEESFWVEFSGSSDIERKKKVYSDNKEIYEKKTVGILENVCTFWKTYANLTLCSPAMRKYFSQECFLEDCNSLLKIALAWVTGEVIFSKKSIESNIKPRDSEGGLFTKLIEYLLTFILATSGADSESKENKVIIDRLYQSLSPNNLKSFDVRKLAEVLLKCSLVQPSRSQTLPLDSTPKFPIAPLWNSCGNVTEVDEGDDRIVSESESLDDNYVTADEGYEADIEVKDTNISQSGLVDLDSLHDVSESPTCLSAQENEPEKTDLTKSSHLIVYPRLCLLAIDLLIKLYQEKSEEWFEKCEEEKKNKNVRDRLSRTFSKQEREKISRIKRGRSSESKILKENIFQKDAGKEESKTEKLRSETSSKDSEGKHLVGLISTFQRLAYLCKEKPQNCSILCERNLIFTLLRGFQSCLVEKNERFSELQKAVLDLVTILAKHSITPEELTFYLSFFKRDNPPVNYLLSPLLSLVTSHSSQPNCTLRFPATTVSDHATVPDIEDLSKSSGIQHDNEGVISCWNASALSLPIGSEMNWSVWGHGFSLSIWLKIEKTAAKFSRQIFKQKNPHKPHRKISKAESHFSACSTALSATSDIQMTETFGATSLAGKIQIPSSYLLHVFSIGHEALTLECWSVLETEVLLWRLTRIDSQRGHEILAEKTTDNCLPLSSWNHVAVNVKDSVARKKNVIEVTLIINGGPEVTIPLFHSGLLFRRHRASSLMLGARSSRLKECFFFGSIMLFSNPVFTRERAVYLLALGPNCTNLTDCQIGRRNPNFTSVFGMRTLTSEINWEVILDARQGIIREIQNNLLLIYLAERPYAFDVYPCEPSGSSSLFPGLRSSPSESKPSTEAPISMAPILFVSLDVKKHQGLIPSCTALGGSATFLFLFARVVELSDNPDEQGKCLYLFLKLVQSDCELFSQFVTNDHHNMLRKVFAVSKCLSGLHILKAILDACCDKPVVQYNAGKFQIVHRSDAIIINSYLIATILSSWKDWRAAVRENEVLGIFFSVLDVLLHDEHPHREFNVSQLNRVQMVSGLLSFCKEKVLCDDMKTLKPEVCTSLVELIKSLMGAPPEFSHIVAVVDCLILLHPATATYVTHVKSSFYILLSAGQTYCSRGKSCDDNLRERYFESDSSKRGSHQFLDNWMNNLNFNGKAKKIGKNNFKQTVDPSKLNKALANLQVKQNACDEVERNEEARNRIASEELDSNRYSDDLTFDSGIAGSCREQAENLEENDEIIVKAVDGSRQNLTSFFPSTFGGFDGKTNSCLTEVSDEEDEEYSVEKETKEIEEHEDCGPRCVIVEGLLLLLRDVILVLPDSAAQQILSHVVKPETLLVMANHKDYKVRSAVVKVFSSYLQRSSDEEINKFIKLRGFFHLANQISLFPASRGLVEDCLRLMTRCSISLEQQDFINQYEMTDFGLASLPLLLALLPRSVHDFSLAHDLIIVIRLIYCKNESTSRSLLESGLLETLVKTLVASAHFTSVRNEKLHRDLVLLDIFEFFVIIINQALNTSGLINMQIVSDVRLELHYLYRLEKESCGSKSCCVRIIRDTLCKVLEKTLDILHGKILNFHTVRKSMSVFSSVLNGSVQEHNDSGLLNSSRFSQNNSESSYFLYSSHFPKEISKNELSDRFRSVIVSTVEFLIYSDSTEGRSALLSSTEINFVYRLFPSLLQMLSSTLEKRSLGRRQSGSVYWAVRDTLKIETSELLVWLLSPRQTVKTRMFAIAALTSQPDCKGLLSALLRVPNRIEEKFTTFLWDLMYNNKLSSTDLKSCQELKESIQQWGIISPRSIGNSNDMWGDVCNGLLTEHDRQSTAWKKQMEATAVRCITKHDHLVKGMSDDALAMTRLVVDAQNTERKSFMEVMKSQCSESIQMSRKWSRLIENLTHEKAVWFFEKSYPAFWELDPTEGPSRVRKRLVRCRLNIDERYFVPSRRQKVIESRNPEPLSYLFEEQKNSCVSTVLIERLHCNEKIRAMFSVNVVTPATEIQGELLVGETCIYFVADDRRKFQTSDVPNAVWPFEEIKEIHNRRYDLQERAVEIFLMNGKTFFIAFETSKERDALMSELEDRDLPNRVPGESLTDVVQLWRERLITNWDYLTYLNKTAGRSYNDLMQYPVYPFVLSDYTSLTLDLNDGTVYRNFKKPMAVQEKKNERHYVNNYNELLSGLKQVTLNKEPYHYGSHYSNSGTVLHFLVRLPPFTKMLLQYQDRNFDLPDRTFHSLHTTWRLASSESTTDVKEMLPEFFFLPEFLTNFQGFNFGVRQNGETVDDVILPPWSKGDPRKFILVHRQALESDYVTENLPHWIDLVFGYKQTGKAAVDAINVFHPATYCGFDVESIADPVERIAWETMVKTYGQTPKQLFKSPHPLVIQSLIQNPKLEVSETEVKGLKWGSYVGSPADPEPIMVWRQHSKSGSVVAALLPLSTNDVLGLPSFATAILQYGKERGSALMNSTGLRIAVVSWGHSDGIIRVKTKRELPATPLLFVSHLDPVTTCASDPGYDHLWIGHSSGKLSVYKFKFATDREFVEFSDSPVILQGHKKAVTHVAVCKPFSVAVTGGQDGSVIIWDLNCLSYVRSLDLNSGLVKTVAVSSTLGDVATVSETAATNLLHLHSINAGFVGSIAIKDTVCSVCFSTAPEGISINVVACGLHNGMIRLYSGWDLTHVRDIVSNFLTHSVVSLTYSFDSQLLYASFMDGAVVAWENPSGKNGNKTPKFTSLKL